MTASAPPAPRVTVQPMPWATVELLTTLLRKLAHDLTNSLVAGVSLLDLTLLRFQDPGIHAALERVRGQMNRPQATLRVSTRPLPRGSGERPRSTTELERILREECASSGIELRWSLGSAGGPPAGLDEAEWMHLLYCLCRNAFEAHEAARREQDVVGEAPWLEVRGTAARGQGRTVEIRDNGPGCDQLDLAARGELRRSGGGHLGLGLVVSAALLAKVGGQLQIESGPNQGFLAEVQLPPGA